MKPNPISLKKQFLLIAACLLSGLLSLQAQFRVAITGGVQRSMVPGNGNPGWDTVNYKYSQRNGQRIGILADWHFTVHSKFYLQSGMYYSDKGRNLLAQYDPSTSDLLKVNGQQHLNYVEMPLNLVVKLDWGKKGKLTLGAGPYIGFLFSGKERRDFHFSNGQVQTLVNTDLKVTTAPRPYNNTDYGVNGTLGVEFGRFFVNVQYTEGRRDFQRSAIEPGTFRHQTLSGSVGVFLNKPTTVKPAKRTKEKPAKENRSKSKRKQPTDLDNDGIADAEDACPDLPGLAAFKGCPDTDGDSIPDLDDKCHDVKGLARYNGCPIPDTDKDGVNDEEDKCPQEPGFARYSGCPIPDTDGDGINDEQDQCVEVKGLEKYNGCPIPDTDQDGVNDEEDKCPSEKGIFANAGCPKVNELIEKKVKFTSRKVQFGYRSVRLTDNSRSELDKLVRLLKQNRDLNLIIEGHTSADGRSENHLPMSQARAEAVMKYLVSKGIAERRLKAIGYGSSRPLVKGTSSSAMARNRRVELKVTNHQVGFE